MSRFAIVAVALAVMALPVRAAEPQQMQAVAQMHQFMTVMEDYFQLIHTMHSVASDPEKAAILHMQKIQEIYKERGDVAEAITVLRDVMKNAKSPAVRSAAATMLADTLKVFGPGIAGCRSPVGGTTSTL